MSRLHLMVGLPCSGKTTWARGLETRHRALRLTLDEWHIRLFGHDFGDNMSESDEETHNSRHEALESLMWGVDSRALVLGLDVILDYGCWTRIERDRYRSKAREIGADFIIHFAEASEDVLVKRLTIRNATVTDSEFFIPESRLKEWMALFEPPAQDELK